MNQTLADLTTHLSPNRWIGAFAYLLCFALAASMLSRLLRAAVHLAMTRRGHLDLTSISFLQQFGSAMIWVVALILYANLIPVLHSMGTALLAGASVASVVIGLAAQSTLGNLVAGVSITIYRPFKLDDTLQVSAPTGTENGVVERISLGYTTLRTDDGRRVVLPNSLAASQVTINLSARVLPLAELPITLRVPRDGAFLEACSIAKKAVEKVQGVSSISSCQIVRVEGAEAEIRLLLSAEKDAPADLHSTVIGALATRFTEEPASHRPLLIA